MVIYGATVENLNIAITKSKTKNDGIYCFRGFTYKVAGGKLTHLAHGGDVLERAGHFNVIIGKYEGVGHYYEKEALKLIK